MQINVIIKSFNRYYKYNYNNPISVKEIKDSILSEDDKILYQNIILVTQYEKVLKDNDIINRSTHLILITRPIICEDH